MAQYIPGFSESRYSSPRVSRSGFNNLGAAVDDLFAAEGIRKQTRNYKDAAVYAGANADFTKSSTAVKLNQEQRNIFKVIGGQQADVASAGFEDSGTAVDLLRDSVAQGSLSAALLTQQGAIDEEGFRVQQRAYNNLADASKKAMVGKYISAGFKLTASAMSLGA